ncbi:MAG: hypothetical protein M0Z61_07410 [Nitrospiraceae bacterium]|nr:hypothetical protein [Nitrospiraceae bacterium]
MARETKEPSIARIILSIVLILFALSAAACAADSSQNGTRDNMANRQNQADEALLSNIKQYCTATLGPGYSLSVQKTYNGGYLFICAQGVGEAGKDVSYPQLVREDRR